MVPAVLLHVLILTIQEEAVLGHFESQVLEPPSSRIVVRSKHLDLIRCPRTLAWAGYKLLLSHQNTGGLFITGIWLPRANALRCKLGIGDEKKRGVCIFPKIPPSYPTNILQSLWISDDVCQKRLSNLSFLTLHLVLSFTRLRSEHEKCVEKTTIAPANQCPHHILTHPSWAHN